jgi:hypothetical protein
MGDDPPRGSRSLGPTCPTFPSNPSHKPNSYETKGLHSSPLASASYSISWTHMISQRHPPDARDHDPVSSGPKPPKRKRRASAREVAESASKDCDASCKTHAKMRHKIWIFPRNPNKELDLEIAQFISRLAAKMRHSRPKTGADAAPPNAGPTPLPTPSKPSSPDPGSLQPPPFRSQSQFRATPHRINKELGSFIFPHSAPRRRRTRRPRESSRIKVSNPSPGRTAGPLACAF